MASTLQTIGRGLIQPVCAAAGPSRTIWPRRSITTTAASTQRQVLGRITPKRIAVRLPAGSGGGEIPKRSVLTPTLVSSFALMSDRGQFADRVSFAWHWVEEDTSLRRLIRMKTLADGRNVLVQEVGGGKAKLNRRTGR
jgi:hypothetical protein